MIEAIDALGQRIAIASRATRIVSLVPSETYSVAALSGPGSIVGRTAWCTDPKEILSLPTCGGTKDVDVAKVIALAPDLVLANQEENARGPIEALIRHGLSVHVSFPRTLADSAEYLVTLARFLGIDPERHPAVTRSVSIARQEKPISASALPIFLPIWNEPLMTLDGRTFASDVLRHVGAENVFADRPRRYPLRADMGLAEPLPAEKVADRDTRYPRITAEEVASRAPRAVLLPNEPHPFGEEDVRWWRERLGLEQQAVRLVEGKDLFWYGAWVPDGVARLSALVSEVRRRAPVP